jgi:peptidoglycan/LPS O-acetylase OafA/YrhL
MNPQSPILAIAIVLVSISTAYCLMKLCGAPSKKGKYASIDGLRGYLAIFVFIHHGYIWYYFLRTNQWTPEPSNLYIHLGQSSVAFFFMITSFLFFNKLLTERVQGIDWGKFFVSRLLRMTPLYFSMIFVLLVIVGIETNWIVNENKEILGSNILHWIAFSIPGAPDINTLKNTSTIVAGVTWSLPYEWFFYFALPIIALTVGSKPPIGYILLSLGSVIFLITWQPHQQHLLTFLNGIVAALLSRSNLFTSFSKSKIASVLAVAAIISAVFIFPSPYSRGPLILLSIAFVILACGNNLFGILTTNTSRTLGEMAYSIYLIHGVILFIGITYLVGAETAKTFSVYKHSLLLLALTPFVIAISYITFQLIEKPGMRSSTSIHAWLKKKINFSLNGKK